MFFWSRSSAIVVVVVVVLGQTLNQFPEFGTTFQVVIFLIPGCCYFVWPDDFVWKFKPIRRLYRKIGDSHWLKKISVLKYCLRSTFTTWLINKCVFVKAAIAPLCTSASVHITSCNIYIIFFIILYCVWLENYKTGTRFVRTVTYDNIWTPFPQTMTYYKIGTRFVLTRTYDKIQKPFRTEHDILPNFDTFHTYYKIGKRFVQTMWHMTKFGNTSYRMGNMTKSLIYVAYIV